MFQPDLINNHLEYQTDASQQCSNEAAEVLQTKSIQASVVEQEQIPNGVTKKKRLSDVAKPNIPGNSVVLSDFHPGNNLESYQVPVVATDKLQPYPPGFITIVKEGPAHETPSSVLLASIEKELEALGSGQRKKNFMASDDDGKHIVLLLMFLSSKKRIPFSLLCCCFFRPFGCHGTSWSKGV